MRGFAVVAMAAVLTLGLGAAAPANAEAPASSRQNLTAEEFASGTLATETTTTKGVVTAAAKAEERCWYIHSAQSGVLSVLGRRTTLWKMEQIVNFCGKKGKVTRVSSVREYFSHLSSLVEVKSKPSHKTSKPSSKEWIVRTSAKLKVCVPSGASAPTTRGSRQTSTATASAAPARSARHRSLLGGDAATICDFPRRR
jgi:hypothetical protein